MNEKRCGCCEGLEKLTPITIVNRPGLDAIAYRAGTHAAFLETMKARLTDLVLDLPVEGEPEKTVRRTPLRDLTTREASDPAIALLDAWATVADVLTFYQERIANEGYLRTATERRSILELARLVGYRLRPGVSASVFLAFTLEKGYKIEIPAGTRAKSIPGPGELPQAFETSESLEARTAWNALSPRMAQPQQITEDTDAIYLQGASTNLKPNDPLLIIDSTGQRLFRRVAAIETDAEASRTKVSLQILPGVLLELSELRQLIQPGRIPEEEGAYSISIGERATGEIERAVAQLLKSMEDESRKPATLAGAIQIQIPRLEQTLRVFKALNFDLLADWVEAVWHELTSLLEQLSSKGRAPGMTSGQALSPALAAQIKELLNGIHPSPQGKPFAREIGGQEMEILPQSMKTLAQIIESTRFDVGSKIRAVRAQILRLDQLNYVFDELGFDDAREWVGELLNALRVGIGEPPHVETITPEPVVFSPLASVITSLQKLPTLPPSHALHLDRSPTRIFTHNADIGPQLLATLRPTLKLNLYKAWGNIALESGPAQVYALRTTASLFGHNAPRQPAYEPTTIDGVTNPNAGDLKPWDEWDEWTAQEDPSTIYLDNAYDEIQSGPGSYIVVEKPNETEPRVFGNVQANSSSRAAYGISAKSTKISLPAGAAWWDVEKDNFSVVRGATVYAQSEHLDLAQAPVESDVAGNAIELDGLYDGMTSGRWLILSGERTDIQDEFGNRVPGVQGTELAMLLRVEQGFKQNLPGETPHSTLILAGPLTYTYQRKSTTIYGNVAKATHGETREEVLGSGDGSKARQQFTLHQTPLTHLPAPTPSGAESTLEVRVDGVRWHEEEHAVTLEPDDRAFITETDDEEKTTVIFGDGEHGARPPTGVENVRAKYRSGIGKPGNVPAEQISLLATKPLGVKSVINPLPAEGGADRESRDQARRNVPLAMMALDRLVSVQDYADFARTYAGIGKASAARLPGGSREIIHITIAGADDALITRQSDLYRNLTQALRRYGDPYQPFRVDLRDLILLVISARVRLHPDYLWELVEPKIRATLLETFGFEQRELGQDALYGEAVAAIQAVPGVAYVDLDLFDGVGEQKLKDFLAQGGEVTGLNLELEHRIPAHKAENVTGSYEIRPAQLILLSPEVQDTLILVESDQ